MSAAKQAQRTPGPWRVSMMPANPNPRIIGADNALILVVSEGAAFAKPTEANAAFIVRACNSHDELLQLVKDAIEDADQFETDWNKAARAAVVKAEA